VVLVLNGGWQTSRQSAYSMATRCVQELHVFVDAETQQTGPHCNSDPVQALGSRWTRDAASSPASMWLDRQPPPVGPSRRSTVDDDLAVAPEPYGLEPIRAQELSDGREISDGLGIDL
jgi:hypothetical protein